MDVLTSENRCSCNGLAVAKASIAGAHLFVLEDFESFSLKPFAQQPRQASVVHATT